MNAPAEYKPVAKSKQSTTFELLKQLTPEIQRALPKGMDSDRIARLVMTEIRKTPRLAECTQQSFAGALLTASALGLEPGVQGECYLVPYRDTKHNTVECQLIVGYQGIVKLFWQHALAAGVTAEWVGTNDTFRFSKGLNPILEHTQAPTGERGNPVYYYAIVRIKGREPLWDVFTPEEIKKLRRGKVGGNGDIADPMHWMERKTALKQVLKLAPKSTRLDMAIRLDENSGTELSKSQAIEMTALIEAPDYIEGEFAETTEPEQSPAVGQAPSDIHRGDSTTDVTPPADVGFVSINDQRKLKNIRSQEKYDADADWRQYLLAATGREIADDKDLTADEAKGIIAAFQGDGKS